MSSDREPKRRRSRDTGGVTYEEIGRCFGISADGARKMAARENWLRERRADGRIVVRISPAELAALRRPHAAGAIPRTISGTTPGTGAEGPSVQRAAGNAIDAVAQRLRQRISSHAIAPGAKLLENDLAREFGVSRARIRDAFVALEMLGLVERIPNRGAVVSRIDLAQVFEIYDVREALESLCVRLAVQNTTPAAWADLAVRFDAISEEQVRAGDMEEYAAAYTELRSRIVAASQNAVLQGMLDSIFEKTHVIMRRVMILPGRPERGLREHRAVLAAMLRGDAAEAERLRRVNIRSAIEDLKRYQHFVL